MAPRPVAVKNVASSLPIESRDAVLRCLKAFLKHPYPEAEGKDNESLGDLTFTSLNSSRLIAIRALIEFEIWVRKKLESKENEDPMPQVIGVLEAQLNVEPTLAGRGVFGERLGWLLYAHRDWVVRNMPLLFPCEPEKKLQRDAVWNCYVTMQGANNLAFEVLDQEYRRAIDEITTAKLDQKNSGHWMPDEGLVHHLCSYYWWGMIPLPNQEGQEGSQETLLEPFYQKAPIPLRQYLLKYIGTSMRNTKEDVPQKIQELLCKLMEWRLSVLEQTNDGAEERAELEGFSTWVDAQKLDSKWTIETLRRVLSLHPKVEDGHDFMLLKPLGNR